LFTAVESTVAQSQFAFPKQAMKVFGGALSRQQESDQSYLGDDHAPYLSLRLEEG
jgi:hypothetical protein